MDSSRAVDKKGIRARTGSCPPIDADNRVVLKYNMDGPPRLGRLLADFGSKHIEQWETMFL